MGSVIRVDLRDPEVRGRVRAAPAGAVLTTLYREFAGGPHGSMEEVPLRLLILLPVDKSLRDDAERLALGLVGADPAPRTMIALVSQSAEEPSHEPVTPDKVLPAEFALQPSTRFVDLRGSMVAVGHPRSGVHAVGTGPTDRWATSFVDDLVDQLKSIAVFDAVWFSIPSDRPAAIGMRQVDLGSGRERAIADVAYRLAQDLSAQGEPELGRALPDRWEVDPRLQAPKGPFQRSATARNRIPKTVLRLGDLENAGVLEALSRSPREYERDAGEAVALLESEPRRIAALFEAAVGSAGDATVDAAGAAAIDRELGGIVFGDPVARESEQEGHDMVAVVGERLEAAASQAGQGLSPAILMSWLRDDAVRAAPAGPGAGADYVGNPQRPWNLAHNAYTEMPDRPRWRSRPWLGAAHSGLLREPVEAGPEAKGLARPWSMPVGLDWIAGAPMWRSSGARFATVLVLVVILAAVIGQAIMDATGWYPINLSSIGIYTEPWRTIGRVLLVVLVAYLLLAFFVGQAIRAWAKQFEFRQIPEALMDLDAAARAYAVSEIARCVPRREGARVAIAAADTLEKGITLGAKTAQEFAESVDPGPSAFSDESELLPPYRVPITGPGGLAVTDAAGIYRLYPHYVAALRRSFATALVESIHAQWPRVRGVFWAETADIIANSASASLRRRLKQIREVGIWQGELARELADEMWNDPTIRGAAVSALDFTPDDPIAMLGAPADQRLLDIHESGATVLAIPPQLEAILADRIRSTGASLVISDRLETATVLRVFPFQSGLYTFTQGSAARTVQPDAHES